jgi:hypothetical protein
MTTWQPKSTQVGSNFADKPRSLCRYSSLAPLQLPKYFRIYEYVDMDNFIVLICGNNAQILFASISYILYYNFAEERFGRTRGSVVVKALCYIRNVARSNPRRGEFLSIYPIYLTSLGSGFYSVTNRNECQKQKNNVSGE